MNAEDLRFFLAVRQAGSIKGGARLLKVDHSTVSRRLAALEEALDARLFERTPEGLLETDVGRAIGPLAERIELLTRELQDAANAASDSPTGPVRIAVSPLIAEHFLVPLVPELQRRFPNVGFDIVADISRTNVLRREADIAIRQHPTGKAPAESSALAMKIGVFAFAAYASPAYLERHGRPEGLAPNLAGHQMISTGKWAPGNAWNEQLEHPAEYILTVYPFSTATVAATTGIGIAVLPCLGADTHPNLVRLTPPLDAYDIWIVSSPEVQNNQRVKAVKEVLIEMLRAAAPAFAGTAGPRNASPPPPR
jgi:DNA-binding transcriptional LysR family regulator